MKRKIRVLVLAPAMSLTGAPQTALTALEEMSDEMSFCTLALEHGPLEERYARLGPVFCLQKGFPGPLTSPSDSIAGKARRMAYPLLRRRVMGSVWSRRLQRWKPDVIYVNTVAALPIAQMMAIPPAPLLLHVKELDSLLATADARTPALLRSRPAHYLAVSDAVRNRLMETYQVPDEKITVVHAYVREEKFTPYLEARSQREANAPFVVGGAGTTDWRKGTQLWLLMASELRQMLGENNVRFVWVGVGGGESDWQFRQMARLMQIDHLIEFVPSTNDPLKYFAGFDAFAMTSWEDPCPVVVIESLMLQIPVVCFDKSGGAPEEVGETGVVVSHFSPRGMAEALAELAASPERREELGRAGRERAIARFTSTTQVPLIRREIMRLARNKNSHQDSRDA